MKRILALILCLTCIFSLLVSCGDSEIDKIKDKIDDYEYDPEIKELVQLNMYIICEEGCASDALNTVKNEIADYTENKYMTRVNVKYLTENEYVNEVLGAVALGEKESGAADIVLVNSKELMYELVEGNYLAPLQDYISSDKFGRINTTIPTSLIQGSFFETEDDGEIVSNLYSIPNNHVIGRYEYLVINKEIATQMLDYSPARCNSFDSYESTIELRKEIAEAGLNPEKYVYTCYGPYELRDELSEGNYVNIANPPIVDHEEAFLSAFAIVNRNELKNDRAMEIIYEINHNKELRNILQYGVRGSTYNLVYEKDEFGKNIDGTERVVLIISDKNTYKMKLEYTGNIFNALLCDEIGWNEEVYNNGVKQNEVSVAK